MVLLLILENVEAKRLVVLAFTVKRLVEEAKVAKSVDTVVVPEDSVVKVGVGDIPIVEVEEKMMLDPAVRLDTGLVKKEYRAEVEAVSGIEYPARSPTEKVWIPVEVAEEMSMVRTPEDVVANV